MADVRILLQGLVKDHDHEAALKNLLNQDTANDQYLLSVAFARATGIEQISTELLKVKDNVTFYIGISNGVTSVQAIQALLDLGISPYVIDMGTNSRIFHPKIYAAFRDDKVEVILGSANMTYTGLNENIEASTAMTLYKSDPSDLAYIEKLKTTLLELQTKYPENVYLVYDSIALDKLLTEGRLEDETIRRKAIVIGHSEGTVRTTKAFPVITKRKRKTSTPIIKPRVATLAQGVVWRSKELTERDLTIPTGPNTNPTGSMYFKKGLLEGVDQRHYFRNEVFSGLNWAPDVKANKSHMERAIANFELIIDGISIGTYPLRLSHNTLTNTATYKQRNAMTQVHWGDIATIIKDRGLLNKKITLYHIGNDNYQMAID